MLFMALAWIGLIVAVIWGIGRLFPREQRSVSLATRESLARRYALGELSEAEYLKAMSAINYEERTIV
jgi:uncharacterized membrane protein